MDFSQALKELKNGKAIKIRGLNGYFTLDKDNNIIAGNGIVEAAGSVGLENVKIIETIANTKITDLIIS